MDVDDEAPSPVCLSQISTNDWSNSIPDTSYNFENCIVPCILFQRNFVGQDDFGGDHYASTAGALQRSPDKKHRKCMQWCTGAECAAKQGCDEGGLNGSVSAEDVGELAPEGDECGGREIEGRDYPIHLRELICLYVSI